MPTSARRVAGRALIVLLLLAGAAACGDDDTTSDTTSEAATESGDATGEEQPTTADEAEDGATPIKSPIGAPPVGQIVADIFGEEVVIADIAACILDDGGTIQISSDQSTYPSISMNLARDDAGALEMANVTISNDDAGDVYILATPDANLTVDDRYVLLAANSFSQPGDTDGVVGTIRATCE